MSAAPFTHRQILTILGGLMAGMALASLDQTIVATSLPTIVGELGGLEQIPWVVSAYLLTETISTPIYGKLSDLFGRRAMFRSAIVIFVAGSMLCGLAQNLWMLIAFRAIQGIGAGGLVSMAFATMGDVISPRERGRYTGWFSSVFAVTSVIGPLIGGFLTDHVSWRWIFYVNVPVGIVAMAITSRALRGLPKPERTGSRSIDVMGAFLLTVGVSCILLALEWGGTQYPWGSPVIVGLAATGAAVIGSWIRWEAKVEDPIVPLRMFRIDVVAVAALMSFLVGVVMFGCVTYLPLFLQVVKGVSASSSGLLLVPLMLGVLLAATLAGRRISTTGRYRFTGPLGFGVIAVGTGLVATMGTGTPLPFVFAVMAVLGVGVGVLSPPLTVAVQNVVDPADIGTGTSAVMFMRTMGAAVGVATFGAIFSSQLSGDTTTTGLLHEPAAIDQLPAAVGHAVRAAAADALHPVFLAGTLTAALGLLVALRLREVPLRTSAHVVAADH